MAEAGTVTVPVRAELVVGSSTVEMSQEIELRRWRLLGSRLRYVEAYMSAGDAALLHALIGGSDPAFLAKIDEAIDRLKGEARHDVFHH